MSRLSSVFILFVLLTSLFSCERLHHVAIVHSSYSDSIDYVDKRKEYNLKLISDVHLDLLTTLSDDEREQKIVKTINNFITSQLAEISDIESGDSLAHYLVQSYLEEMLEMAMSRYTDEYEEYPEELDSMLVYDEEIDCTFFNNIQSECHFGLGDTIVCFTGNSSCYMGGAHPGEESFAYSFSLVDGNMVRIGTLLRKDCKGELLDRIKRKLMSLNHVDTEDELSGLGFKDIFISPHILLEKDSITFHYKNYTIAPFYLGAINIRFGYDELKDLLNIKI